MSVEVTDDRLIEVVTTALKTANKTDALSEAVSSSSRMGTPREWDSLSFVSVFMAVGEAFDIELDDDDAIHFQTLPGIKSFVEEVLAE